MLIYKMNYRVDQVCAYPFSEYYQAWIISTISPKVTIRFSDEGFEIEAENSDQEEFNYAIIFIGYAYGQQDNGR